MECLSRDTASNVVDIMRKFVFQDHCCSCLSVASFVVTLGESLTMGSREVKCGVTIVTDDDLGPPKSFMGIPLTCTCDGSTIFDSIMVRMTLQQWSALGEDKDKVILVAAKCSQGVIDVTSDESAIVQHRRTVSDGYDKPLMIGELFSGGYGGWSHAVRAIASLHPEVMTAWALDHDPISCMTHARSHGMSYVATNAEECWNQVAHDEEASLLPTVTFQTDIQKVWWLTYAIRYPCQIVTWSAPCPPWSSANTALGLDRQDGLVFVWTVMALMVLRPRVTVGENVGGLVKHAHWPVLQAILSWAGYRVIWKPLLNLSAHVPQNRDRVLLVLANVADTELEISCHCLWPIGRAPTLGDFGAIMDVEGYWLDEATLTKHELDLYVNPRFLPRNAKSTIKKQKRDVVAYRFRTKDGVASCFLTTYGSPLAIPEHLAEENGIYGSLYMAADTVRRFVIPEILVLMGTICKCWLPKSREISTFMLGNAIATPHALLAVLNAMLHLRPDWFPDGVQSVFASLMAKHMRVGDMTIIEEDDGFWYAPFRSALDDCPPTLKYRCIQPLTIKSPLQTLEMMVEEGVNIPDMLRLMCGRTAPPHLELLLNGQQNFKFPLHDNAKMPHIRFRLQTMYPSCLWPDETTAMRCDWPIVVFLTPMVTVVLKRNTELLPVEVNNIMQECAPDVADEGRCLDIFARKPIEQVQCRNYMLFLDEFVPCDIPIPEGVVFVEDHQSFVASVSEDHMMELLLFMRKSSLLKIILSFGWSLVQDFAGYRDTVKPCQLCVKLVPTEGRLSLLPDHFRHEIITCLFMKMLDMNLPQRDEAVFVGIKLWDTWIWHRWVPIDMHIGFIHDAWRSTARFFDFTQDIRLISAGKLLIPECTFRNYVDASQYNNNAAGLGLHVVFPLHGGGPSSSNVPEDVRDVVCDDGDSASREATPEYGSQKRRRRVVSDTVEGEVADMLDRLLSTPSEDRFISPEILEGLTLIDEDDQLTMHGSINKVIRFMEAAQRTGIETVLHESGWHLVVRFPTFKKPYRVQMLLTPISGMRAKPISLIRGFMVSALTACMMPTPGFEAEGHILVQVNLWGVLVTNGWFRESVLAGQFNRPWELASAFVDQRTQMRMIYGGKQIMPEFPISAYEIQNRAGKRCMKVHLVLQLHGGGPSPTPDTPAKSKPDAIVRAKSELAKLFLDVGCELAPLTKVADAFVKKAGLTALNAALRKRDHADRLIAIQGLASSFDITLPDFNQMELRRNQANSRRLQSEQTGMQVVNASAYVVKEGFFHNTDKTPCPNLKVLKHAATGIYLCDEVTAQPWIKGGAKVSQDELGMLVLGGCGDCRSNRSKMLSIPAFDLDNFPVVLSVCLHQLGQKEVSIQDLTGADVHVEDSVVCSITCYRDEIGDEAWTHLTDHPVRAALALLTEVGVQVPLINAPWGRSYWGPSGKTTPQKATSLQMHVRVATGDCEKFLKGSGMAGVYINPKTSQGAIDTDFAIVWSDEPLAQLRVTASAMSNALGLVRITRSKVQKTSRGIRVRASDFEEAFKKLKPSSDVPKHVKVQHMAKLTPTPVGVSQAAVKQWLEQVALPARPIKPLGRQTWLLGFAQKVENQWWAWNGQVMMLNFLPNREQVAPRPVVASAAPKNENKPAQHTNGDTPVVDAWAEYRLKQGLPMPAAPAAATASQSAGQQPVRVTEGPIEQRFQQQDQQIDELKRVVQDMKGTVVETQKQQKEFESAVSDRFGTMEKEVTKQFGIIGAQFENTLTAAMRKQDKQMTDCFSEFKQLLAQASAANAPTPGKKPRLTPRKDGIADEEDGNL